MKIREVALSEKDQFNSLTTHPVQSWEWGDFREQAGNKVLRLGVYQDDELTQVYLLTIHKIPKTKYYVAMCAKCNAPSLEVLNELREFVRPLNIIMIRMEPNISINDKDAIPTLSAFKEFGAKPGRAFFNKSTFIIDLTKSEDELLKAMHSKTRYSIRVAQRNRVEIKEDNSPTAFAKYLDLMDETTSRQHYFNHNEHYHKLMWQTLRLNSRQAFPMVHLLTTRYKNDILNTWIVFAWHDTLYYPYGASSSEHRKIMPGYATMWEAIKFGKKLGLKKFDLWGRDEGKGFTKFKEGFNPEIVEFIGTWDIPVSPHLHKIYRLLEEVRWMLLKARAKFIHTSSFR